jgi:hypothetical protein
MALAKSPGLRPGLAEGGKCTGRHTRERLQQAHLYIPRRPVEGDKGHGLGIARCPHEKPRRKD